jgi:hypothetical protein
MRALKPECLLWWRMDSVLLITRRYITVLDRVWDSIPLDPQ